MNTVIRMKAGTCAILFASLMATTGPAVAKVTIQCKNEISTSAGYFPSEAQAANAAENLWKQEVLTKYGALSWTYFSNAKGIQYNCVYSASEGGWRCLFKATPCSPVTPPSSSAANPEPPPSRATRKVTKRRRNVVSRKRRIRTTSNFYPTIPNLPRAAITTNIQSMQGMGGARRNRKLR